LDSRTKAWAVAVKVEGKKAHATRSRSRKLVFCFPRDCLDLAECLLDPHCECVG
jgi:hypothetical protein